MRWSSRWSWPALLLLAVVVVPMAAGTLSAQPPASSGPSGDANGSAADKGLTNANDAADVYASLRDAINYGAELFNKQADHAGCYRIYQGALIAVRPLLVPDMRRKIDDGIVRAEVLPYYSERAFELRKILDEIRAKSAPAKSGVPVIASPNSEPPGRGTPAVGSPAAAPRIEATKPDLPRIVETPHPTPKADPPKVATPQVTVPRIEAPQVDPPKVDVPQVATPPVVKPTIPEPKKVDPPKIDPPVFKPTIPEPKKVDPPKIELPKEPAKTNPSKVDPPKIELPKVDPPKVELPKVELPKVELPKVELPKVGADVKKPVTPKVEAPKVELPKVRPAGVEVPKVELPKVTPPTVNPPKIESPKIELPSVSPPPVVSPPSVTPPIVPPGVPAPVVPPPVTQKDSLQIPVPPLPEKKTETAKVELPKVELPSVSLPSVPPPGKVTPPGRPLVDLPETGKDKGVVSGVVMLEGKPLPTGYLVTLVSEGGKRFSALVQKDGTFQFTTGLAHGTYRVAIAALPGDPGRLTMLPKRYLDETTSGLTLQVSAGKVTPELRLTK